MWFGIETTDAFVVVVIVLLFGIGWATSRDLGEHPAAWIVASLAGVFVFWKAILQKPYLLYASERARRESLEQKITPRLSVEEPHLADAVMGTATATAQVPAKYVRVRVRNGSSAAATGCSAKLIKIEFLEKDVWRQLAYNDTLDMPWAGKMPPTWELNLGPGATAILDVVFATALSRELHLATITRPHYPALMALAGQYQFTFHLTSTDAGSRTARLRLHWGLDINTLQFPANPVDIS